MRGSDGADRHERSLCEQRQSGHAHGEREADGGGGEVEAAREVCDARFADDERCEGRECERGDGDGGARTPGVPHVTNRVGDSVARRHSTTSGVERARQASSTRPIVSGRTSRYAAAPLQCTDETVA